MTEISENDNCIPDEIKRLRQWSTWRLVDGRKVPKQPSGQAAKSNDPTTWCDFSEVANYSQKMFFLKAENGLVGIDLDDCSVDGKVAEWAAEIIERFANVAYIEVSPSGEGVKLLTRGTKPVGSRSNVKLPCGGGVECYNDRRGWTVTGRAHRTANQIGDGQAEIDWLIGKYFEPQATSQVLQSPPQDDRYAQAKRYLAKCDQAVEGERNNAAFRLAGHLAAFRLTQREVEQHLALWNLGNSPPLDEQELLGTVRSAMLNGTPRPPKELLTPAVDALGQQAATAFLAGEATQGPQIVPFSEMRRSHPTLREPVVDGLLRAGETMNVIASPKAGKSWLMLSLAFAVSEGREWMGARCKRGRVLMIDNELHAETLADRFETMRDALGEDETQIDALSLRGENCDLLKLSTILDAIEPGSYRLIVLDALYRFLPQGTSENDNAQMMQLYNLLDAIAQRTGSAIAVVHHSSKGNQANKSQTDIGAGAGSIARAADTHLTIRPHEEAGYFVLEAATRSFQQPEPISVYFKFPRWEVSALEANLKPERRNHQAEKDQETRTTLLQVLKADKWTPKTKVRDLTGFGFERITRGMRQLIESNQVVAKRVKSKAHRGKTVDVYQLTADVESLVNLV